MTPGRILSLSPASAAIFMAHAMALAAQQKPFDPITDEEREALLKHEAVQRSNRLSAEELRDAVQRQQDLYVHDIDPRFMSKRRVKSVKFAPRKTEHDFDRIKAAEAKRQRKAEKLRAQESR